MTCRNPGCRATIPLPSSFWQANSTRREAWVEITGKPGVIGIKVMHDTRPPDDQKMAHGTVRSSSVICPACATSMPASGVRGYVKKIGFGR
jgi:hypothetical protein